MAGGKKKGGGGGGGGAEGQPQGQGRGRGQGQGDRGGRGGGGQQQGRGGGQPQGDGAQQQQRGGGHYQQERGGFQQRGRGQQQERGGGQQQRGGFQQQDRGGGQQRGGFGRGQAFGRGQPQGEPRQLDVGQSPPQQQMRSLEESFPALGLGDPRSPRQQTPPAQAPVQTPPPQSPRPPPVQAQAPPPAQVQAPPPAQAPHPAQARASAPVRLELAHRKTEGTKGRRTMVETNHMALKITPPKAPVIHYDVTLDPDKPKRLLRPAVMEFVRQFCKGRNPAFDGRKNLFSCGDLPVDENREYTVNVNNPERGNVEVFKVSIKHAATIDLSSISRYLASKDKVTVPQEALKAIDIIMRQAAAAKMTQVGRSFFSPPQGHVADLGNGLELWVGVFQSAVLGWKPFINVDVAHKGFPRAQPVVKLIEDLYNDYRNTVDLRQELRDTRELESFIRGLKVDYQIPNHPNSKRTYRVNGVKECASRLTFNTQDDGRGEQLSVATYFAREKNYRLQYPNLPCLHVGSVTRNIFLPVELCTVMTGQVIIKKMNENQTAEMIKHAATPAEVRKKKIMDAFAKLGLNRDPVMNEFGISVSGEMEKIEARVLAAPSLDYRNGEESVMRGVWRADRKQFLIGGSLPKWAVLVLEKRTFDNKVQEFIAALQSNARNCGMSMEPCSKVCNANPFQKQSIIRELEGLRGCSIVFVIVPDRGETYGIVKQIAELQFGMLTQCLKSTTVNRKMSPATAYNILLKVNAKLNGVNHCLSSRSRPPCLNKPVMLMGADVTHPPPEAKNSPSIAAVTASHDPRAFQYNIEWRLQPPRMEIIQDLENIVRTQLQYFRKKTGKIPDRIIFYRDGVSDGQFAEVLSTELQAMRRACASLNANYKPAITFLVVQKRHHTRFFPTRREDEDGKNKNVPPGLVVDKTITHPRDMDFYLVSHQSIQGTSRPTKYCVLHDDADMSEDDVEQLTYYLCHLFSRCNRSVSYPAPTYYAHLAAFRAKAYLEGQNVNIDNLPREQNMRIIQSDFKQNSPMFFV